MTCGGPISSDKILHHNKHLEGDGYVVESKFNVHLHIILVSYSHCVDRDNRICTRMHGVLLKESSY